MEYVNPRHEGVKPKEGNGGGRWGEKFSLEAEVIPTTSKGIPISHVPLPSLLPCLIAGSASTVCF